MSIPAYATTAIPGACNPVPEACQKPFDPRNPLIAAQIANLNANLISFMNQCDYVLNQLNSARNTELLDMGTSNTNLLGYFVSNMSYHKNHEVAGLIDGLQRDALRINSLVTSLGFFSANPSMTHLLLNTQINGNGIRRSEDAEHNIVFDWFTNGTYSSMGSANTVGEIQSASSKVSLLRSQAQSLLTSTSMIMNPQMPMGNFSTGFPTV